MLVGWSSKTLSLQKHLPEAERAWENSALLRALSLTEGAHARLSASNRDGSDDEAQQQLRRRGPALAETMLEIETEIRMTAPRTN